MQSTELLEAKLTGSIIGAFYEVYNELRYGFLESIYKAALERELMARGHQVGREVSVRVFYKNEPLAYQRLDMLVDDTVIVEAKTGLSLHPVWERQVYNYLRAAKREVGLLLFFGPEARFVRILGPSRSRSA